MLGIALAMSRRSHDINSQVGCVITDSDNRILGCGYNGFPRGMPDDELPRTRPVTPEDEKDICVNKYLWMLHAERNALDNCNGKPDSGTAYVTHYPICGACAMGLSQQGIKRVVCNNKTFKTRYADFSQSDFIFKKRNIKYEVVNADLSWLAGVILNT